MITEDIQIMARNAARSGFKMPMLAYTNADQRDYIHTVLPATKVSAHPKWLATRGMNVYERMEFDRLYPDL